MGTFREFGGAEVRDPSQGSLKASHLRGALGFGAWGVQGLGFRVWD